MSGCWRVGSGVGLAGFGFFLPCQVSDGAAASPSGGWCSAANGRANQLAAAGVGVWWSDRRWDWGWGPPSPLAVRSSCGPRRRVVHTEGGGAGRLPGAVGVGVRAVTGRTSDGPASTHSICGTGRQRAPCGWLAPRPHSCTSGQRCCAHLHSSSVVHGPVVSRTSRTCISAFFVAQMVVVHAAGK